MDPNDSGALRFEAKSCPVPIHTHRTIQMGHGGGGRLMTDLIEHVFRKAFAETASDTVRPPSLDAAILEEAPPGGRLAVTTDGFVVRPWKFPGGTIGELAIHGTLNDLAMVGARPFAITAGFILEEGLDLERLEEIARRMGQAAAEARVRVVAGDTKVVERGHGDGCYITTTGLGWVSPGVELGPARVRPGDVVIVSGTVGDHGLAVLSARQSLGFATTVTSDTASLWPLVEPLLAAGSRLRCLRDATRGGLLAVLHEVARDAKVGVRLVEGDVPVQGEVRAACELLGLDPFSLANEGKCVLFVSPESAEAILQALHAHPLGREAARIGVTTPEHPGLVMATTPLGTTRVIPEPAGELLPRIC